MAVKRQFIAGARCPQCGEIDRVQRCRDEERVWMECIACGMKKYPEEQPGTDRQAELYRGPPK